MRRRLLVPEVIQTSAMDCGPAALKALFGGFGVYLSYGRLREACQTDVDGTSIDTLEETADQLGMSVSQMMVPADLFVLDPSRCLPAIVVLKLPGGSTHFVVVWRMRGPLVQIMDPAAGRVWISRRRLQDLLYTHQQEVPRDAWTEWSESNWFLERLRRRMRGLGVPARLWDDRAHLDASLRIAQLLVNRGSLRRGDGVGEFLRMCAQNPDQIPVEYWTARTTGSDTVLLRGAVLVAAEGPKPGATEADLPESLQAVLHEPPRRVWSPLWSAVRAGGLLVPATCGLAIAGAAIGTVAEILLFRGFLDISRHLLLSAQRLAAITAVALFLSVLLVLEWAAARGLLRLGRHLELRLRTRYLAKIPKLSDRYFQSRLISDMAFRAHSLQLLRQLPDLAGRFARHAASILLTAAAIAWFYPGLGGAALLAAIVGVGVPLLFAPALTERDLRFRELSGSLSRFYLDALRGVRAIQAHGAQPAIGSAHGQQLGQWAEAGLRRQTVVVRGEAMQMVFTLGLVIWLVWSAAVHTSNPATLLLLIYWALSIPENGRQLAAMLWELPSIRNTMLRFLEPLGAPEEETREAFESTMSGGVQVDARHITVLAGGKTILQDVNLRVAPGEHVAVVGLSGAGKSSLVGLMLGWHKPSAGSLAIDGAPLDASRMSRLRRDTAWIDPQVHLFNTTLWDNLKYGNGDDLAAHMDAVLEDAGVSTVLGRLPEGLQTKLGDGGALVSGGEGQRVRAGRAMARSGVRLAILDEPARGLDREQRSALIEAARARFAGATLFCITHDVAASLKFDRVLVVEAGRILEDGSPRQLYDDRTSRYRALCDEEQGVRRHLWLSSVWRRFRLERGEFREAEANSWTRA